MSDEQATSNEPGDGLTPKPDEIAEPVPEPEGDLGYDAVTPKPEDIAEPGPEQDVEDLDVENPPAQEHNPELEGDGDAPNQEPTKNRASADDDNEAQKSHAKAPAKKAAAKKAPAKKAD